MPSFMPKFAPDTPENSWKWRHYCDNGTVLLLRMLNSDTEQHVTERVEAHATICANLRGIELRRRAAITRHPAGRALPERQSPPAPEPETNRSIIRDLWSLLRKAFK